MKFYKLFYEIIEELSNYKHIYTNSSKTEKGTRIFIIAANFQLKIK